MPSEKLRFEQFINRGKAGARHGKISLNPTHRFCTIAERKFCNLFAGEIKQCLFRIYAATRNINDCQLRKQVSKACCPHCLMCLSSVGESLVWTLLQIIPRQKLNSRSTAMAQWHASELNCGWQRLNVQCKRNVRSSSSELGTKWPRNDVPLTINKEQTNQNAVKKISLNVVMA